MQLHRFLPFILMSLLCSASLATPTDTSFTYQGRLKKTGIPVNTTADLTFSLYDAAAGGSQIGLTQTASNISLTDGLLTVDLDFGASAFDGNGRWLQITARSPAGSGSFTTLTPRQPILPAPYALYALNASPIPSGLMVLSSTSAAPAGFTFTGHQLSATNPWVNKPAALASGNSLNLCTNLLGKVYHVPSSSNLFSAFDPATNAWTARAFVPAVINSGCLVGAQNKVMFVNPATGPSYVYDPGSNTWANATPMTTLRVTSAGEFLGLVFTCGGFITPNYSAVVESYDPSTNSWTPRQSLPAQRLSGSVTSVGGKLYYAGGVDNTGAITTSLYVYDPVPGTWSPRASLLSPRTAHGSGEANGKLYIFGGASAAGVTTDTTDIYDPATDTWTRLPARINTQRFGPGGTSLNGKLYIVGGNIPPSTPTTAFEELLAPPAAFYIMSKN